MGVLALKEGALFGVRAVCLGRQTELTSLDSLSLQVLDCVPSRHYDNILGTKRGFPMKTIKRYAFCAVVISTFLGLAGCSGMTQQERNTAIGAGAGAVGGSILTGGSTAGTLGGAAIGGIIGHEVDK